MYWTREGGKEKNMGPEKYPVPRGDAGKILVKESVS